MTALSVEQQAMVALFQRHMEAGLAGDLDTTMATMTHDPRAHVRFGSKADIRQHPVDVSPLGSWLWAI